MNYYKIKIELATDEDKKLHIDEWARLFKATTWEELKMIAEKDKVYSEAANSVYAQNSDETVRMMCEARREAIVHEQYVQNRMESLEKQLVHTNEQLSQKDSLIEQLQAEIEKLKND